MIGDVAGVAGNAMWISFILAASIAAFTGLSYAELASMFPKSAAECVFVKSAFRSKPLAFLTGWLAIFVAIASAAAVAIGFSGYLAGFIPSIPALTTSIVLVMTLSAVNLVGIRESMWTNTAFTLVELAGLTIIIGAGLFLYSSMDSNYFEMPHTITSSNLAWARF